LGPETLTIFVVLGEKVRYSRKNKLYEAVLTFLGRVMMNLAGKRNLFDLPVSLPDEEVFESLAPSDHGVLIERIISRGQRTPEGIWYGQDRDEWVALVQGEALLAYEDGTTLEMKAGDHILIPAHSRHRIERTSVDPPCIWIAVHGNLL
jgi:cupin 2 domain-containing protein